MTAADAAVELQPGIWRTQVPLLSGPYQTTANAYLVVDGDESLLVDTAWDEGLDPAHLDALFETSGTLPSQLVGIFLTHAHRDHSGFIDYVHDLIEAPVLVSNAERGIVEASENYQGFSTLADAAEWFSEFDIPLELTHRIFRFRSHVSLIEADKVRWLAPGEVVKVGRRSLVSIHTPGHTPGHSCLWDPSGGALFTGDTLLPRGHGNPHVTLRPYTSPEPIADYLRGLEELWRLRDEIDICLPGHGPTVDDALEFIESHFALVESKLSSALRSVSDEACSAYEIVARMPWGRPLTTLSDTPLLLTLTDGLARLRRLHALGHIERVTVRGSEGYRLRTDGSNEVIR